MSEIPRQARNDELFGKLRLLLHDCLTDFLAGHGSLNRNVHNPLRIGPGQLVQLKGYDDTFAQDVHARNSYIHEEIEWHRRFLRAYEVDEDGTAVIDLNQLHATLPFDEE